MASQNNRFTRNSGKIKNLRCCEPAFPTKLLALDTLWLRGIALYLLLSASSACNCKTLAWLAGLCDTPLRIDLLAIDNLFTGRTVLVHPAGTLSWHLCFSHHTRHWLDAILRGLRASFVALYRGRRHVVVAGMLLVVLNGNVHRDHLLRLRNIQRRASVGLGRI